MSKNTEVKHSSHFSKQYSTNTKNKNSPFVHQSPILLWFNPNLQEVPLTWDLYLNAAIWPLLRWMRVKVTLRDEMTVKAVTMQKKFTIILSALNNHQSVQVQTFSFSCHCDYTSITEIYPAGRGGMLQHIQKAFNHREVDLGTTLTLRRQERTKERHCTRKKEK